MNQLGGVVGGCLLSLTLVVTACAGNEISAERIEDHPSFPCYLWWTASSRVAGLAGVVPWAGEYESASVVTYEELFDLADGWAPESEVAEALRQVRSEMPNDSASESDRGVWRVRVVLAVYEWALFHLEIVKEAVESSAELRDEDKRPLLDYVTSLEGWVEDQWALALPLFDSNPRIDVTTLGVITDTFESDRLFQAWRDVTEESPFDTEAGIKIAAINVCGEDVLEIAAEEYD